MSREEKIIQAFVDLADTLVGDFDVIELLQQLTASCCEILNVTDVAVLLAYPGPDLYSPVPCDPSPALSSVLEPAAHTGPAADAYRTETAVTPGLLSTAPASWHPFTQAARSAGYTHAAAVPLRLRQDTLGSLLLLRTADSPIPPADLSLAQAFADATTIGLVHTGATQNGNPHTVTEQLRTTMHSRILIEQAKGFYAAQRNVRPDDAFTAMRDHARRHGLRLTDVARGIVTTGDLLEPAGDRLTEPRTPGTSCDDPTAGQELLND
ncbi:GAF and ANTAR domain-containing protein [Streptomyces sp. NPDC047070]|uniref:GAF and ANTAR domain-containing protein n=1 Tax=Streptomyces sp. NPDC047070 TaxID=3154923 RepID=UPI003454A769